MNVFSKLFNQIGLKISKVFEKQTKAVRSAYELVGWETVKSGKRGQTMQRAVYRINLRRLERSKYAPWGIGDLSGLLK